MPSEPQPDLTKLTAAYQHALDNSGKDHFYIFLYRYVETIVKDKQLYGAAMHFWGQSIAEDFKDDQQKLDQFVEKVTALTNKPSTYQITDFFVSTFSLIDETKFKETKPYYCWYQLYNSFYGIRTMGLSPEVIRKISALDFDSDEVKALIAKETPWGEKEIQALKLFPYEKLADALEQETKSLTPTKLKLSSDDYLACLTIFHADFTSWLLDKASSFGNIAEGEPLTEAELSFDDIYPVVTITSTGEPYKFRRMVQSKTPYKIIKLLYDSPGIAKSADTLPAHIKLSKKGLIESLRGSDFYPNDGVLALFLTVQKRPAKLMLHRKCGLTAEQLEKLAAIAEKPTTNS